MKKRMGLLVGLMLAVALSLSTVSAVRADAPPQAGAWGTSDYFAVANEGTAEETITSKQVNGGFKDNFFVRSDRQAVGDYTVSATFQATRTSPYNEEVDYGLVPWYVDDNNYIVVYLKWNNETNQMRCMQITGMVNGVFPVIWDNGFRQNEWNDLWMDGGADRQQFLSKSPADQLELKVVKKLSEARDTVIFYGYINNVEIGFISFRDVVKFNAQPAKVGIYAYHDTVTVTDFAVTDCEDNVSTFDYVGDTDYIARSAGTAQEWTADASGITLTPAGTAMYDNALLIKNPYTNSGYALETEVDVTGSGNRAVALYGWYKDEYNYYSLGVKEEGGAVKAFVDGKSTTEVVPDLNVAPFSQEQALDMTLDAVTKLRVEKAGGGLSLFINGSDTAAITANVGGAITVGADVGLTAVGMPNVKFTQTKTETVGYVPYDWFLQELGEEGDKTAFYVSAASEQAVTLTDEKTFAFTVDEEETEHTAGLYTATSMVGELDVSADFTVLDGGTFGLYAWLESDTKYATVTVTPQKLVVAYAFGEDNNGTQDFTLPAEYTVAGEHTLRSKLEKHTLKVWLDEQVVVESYAVAGNDLNGNPYAGVLAAGKDLTVENFAFTGFWPYKEIELNGWKVRGARNDSWTTTENAIIGNTNGGTEFKNTLALVDYTASTDLYFASKVKTTARVSNQYKTGLLPYYKDGDNHVFVWLAQWEGAKTTITATARLNGAAVGAEWREQEVAYTYVGAVNEVEVAIEGDTLKVWLNRSFAPTFTTVIEGLSNRSMTGAKVGFNVFNTTTEFSDFDVSTARIYTNTEKPTVGETGTRVTAATVGDAVSLPVFTAENSVGDTLNAVVTVTDPDGQTVEITKNKFTATAVGEYTVTVTCTDVWGNNADPVTYTVTVTEAAQPAPAESGCGCGSAAGLGTWLALPVILFACAAVALLLRRRKA